MTREFALRIVLGVVGVVFVLLAYPMVLFMRQEPALSMMLSVYVTLGVFLLVAIRTPSANRSVIAFAAWSSVVHAAWMGMQALRGMVDRGELIGVAVLALIGASLLLLPRPLGLDQKPGRDYFLASTRRRAARTWVVVKTA